MNKNKRCSYSRADFRTRDETDGKYIEGYFAVFEQETLLWKNTYEKIARTAFDDSLDGGDIRALFNHDAGIVLGRTTVGTLTLRADSHGLFGSIRVNENDSEALNIYERVKRGDISGCSFGFYPISESYEERSDGTVVWTVEKLEFDEVSVCTFPAYPQTEIHARNRDYEALRRRDTDRRKENIRNKLKKLEVLKNAESDKAQS